MASKKNKVTDWLLWLFADPVKWGFIAFVGIATAIGLSAFAHPEVLLLASPYLAPIAMTAVVATGLMLFAHAVYMIAMGIKNANATAVEKLETPANINYDDPLGLDINDPRPLETDYAVQARIEFLNDESRWQQRFRERFKNNQNTGSFKSWISQPVNYIPMIISLLLAAVMMSLGICWAVDPSLLGHGLNVVFDFVATTLSNLFAHSGMFDLVPGSVANQAAVILVTAFSGMVAILSGKNFGQWVYEKVATGPTNPPQINQAQTPGQPDPALSPLPDPAPIPAQQPGLAQNPDPAQQPKPTKHVPQIPNDPNPQKTIHAPLFSPAPKLTRKQIVDNIFNVINNTLCLIRTVANTDYELKFLGTPNHPDVLQKKKIGDSATTYDKTQRYELVSQNPRQFEWRPSTPKAPSTGPRVYSPLMSTCMLTGAESPLGSGMVAPFSGHNHNADDNPVSMLYDDSKCVKPRYHTCDRHSVNHPQRKRMDGSTAKPESMKAYTDGYVPDRASCQQFVNSCNSFTFQQGKKQLTQTEVLTHIPECAFLGFSFKSEYQFLYGTIEGPGPIEAYCYLQGIDKTPENLEELRLNSTTRLGLCMRFICERIRAEKKFKRDFVPIMVVNARNKGSSYEYTPEEQRKDALLFLSHPELEYPIGVNTSRQIVHHLALASEKVRPETTVTEDVTYDDIISFFDIKSDELQKRSVNFSF